MSMTAAESQINVPRLLSKREVAEWLGLSTRGVDLLRTSGRLPAIKIGSGTVRFDAQDIRAFVDARRERRG